MFKRSYYSSSRYYSYDEPPPSPPPPMHQYGGYEDGYGAASRSRVYSDNYYDNQRPIYKPEMYNPHANLYGPMAIFRQYDRDGDGMITENDFVIALRESGMGFIGDTLARAAFKRLDTNRNGRLDMNEAFQAMKYLRPDLYY